MKKVFWTVAFMAILAGLTGCSSATNESNNSAPTWADYVSGMNTVSVGTSSLSLDDSFYIVYHQGDVAPAYLWKHTSDPGIALLDSALFLSGPAGAVGAGADEVWKFKCVGSGSSVLTFSNSTQSDVYNLTIN